MLHTEREQEILNILKAAGGFVTVKTLCDRLFASESSVRRDLKALEDRGLAKRSYGGASLTVAHAHIVTFNHRARENADAKRVIAQKAAALIKEESVVFLDQSSTSFYLAEQLTDRSAITVVTNNIEIMMLLSGTRVRVISSGGTLSSANCNCLLGGEAQKTFENIYADWLFFSAKALSDDGAVADCDPEEIAVRRAMLKNARNKVFLCDSSKFDRRAVFKQCDLRDVDVLVSEGDIPSAVAACAPHLNIL